MGLAIGLYCAAALLSHSHAQTGAAAPDPARATAPASTSSPAAAASSPAASSPSIFDEDPATLTPPRIPDKIEGLNRAMFRFNDALYKVTLRPLSRGYAAVVPAPLRRGIGRFFHNLAFPTRFTGNLLEGKVRDAGTETGRFVINTFGGLGFLPTADKVRGLEEKPSDLGHAFGRWGIGHGTYIILPLLGPSSVRDGVGLGISGYVLDPIHYLQEWEYRAGATAFSVVNQSPDQMKAYDQLKAAAVDPYVALRDGYSARRTRRVVNETQIPVVPAATSTIPPP